MAGQDFAQVDAPTQPAPKAGVASSILSAFAIIIIAGLCFVAGYWLGQESSIKVPGVDLGSAALSYADQSRLNEQADRIASQEARLDELEKLLAHWKKKAAKNNSSGVGELQFYADLPKQSVMPSPVSSSSDSAKKAVVKQPAARHEQGSADQDEREVANRVEVEARLGGNTKPSAGAYQIQLGSFRAIKDASALEHLLKRSGFTAHVETVNLAGKGQWFRVFSGPYNSRSMANRAKKVIYERLRLSGIVKR